MFRPFIFGVLLLILTGCGGMRAFRHGMASSDGSSTLPVPSQGQGPIGGGPGQTPSPIPSTNLPALKSNAKVFLKNPVFAGATQTYQIYGGGVVPSTPIDFDKYFLGVHLDITGTALKNPDITVYRNQNDENYGGSGLASPDHDGNWFFSSVDDSDHKLGQLMSFYWLDQEKVIFEKIIPGAWAAKGKNVRVYTRCLEQQNAYWAGFEAEYMCIGYVGNMELSWDASVLVHEMGHAHFAYSTNGQIEQDSNTVRCMTGFCCPGPEGCAAALNEGAADVHSQVVFKSGVVGEFAFGNPRGIPGRDSERNTDLTAQAMFDGTARDPSSGQAYGEGGKEIHSMGGVWAAAWWSLRKALGDDVTNQLFLKHLAYLTGNDNFQTALSQVLLADQVLFKSSHAAQIKNTFAHHGITPD